MCSVCSVAISCPEIHVKQIKNYELRTMNYELKRAHFSALCTQLFEYFQTFHATFRTFSNIFECFQTFFSCLFRPNPTSWQTNPRFWPKTSFLMKLVSILQNAVPYPCAKTFRRGPIKSPAFSPNARNWLLRRRFVAIWLNWNALCGIMLSTFQGWGYLT